MHGIDWQREKWKSGFASKFIHKGEENAVKYADEIIVLDDGEVVGIGNHEQLMEQCPVYQEIHQSQFQDRKEA